MMDFERCWMYLVLCRLESDMGVCSSQGKKME